MQSTAQTRPVFRLSPHLVCNDAVRAIEFYKQAFGATEMMRLTTPAGGLVHAAVLINEQMVMLAEACGEHGSRGPLELGGTPVTLHLHVEDVDAWTERAVAAGAKVIFPVADMFWGDRYGIVADPFGHHWSIATHQRDMSMEELQQAMLAAMPEATPST